MYVELESCGERKPPQDINPNSFRKDERGEIIQSLIQTGLKHFPCFSLLHIHE
jgi:hypothetical protein